MPAPSYCSICLFFSNLHLRIQYNLSKIKNCRPANTTARYNTQYCLWEKKKKIQRRLHSNFPTKVTGNGFYPFCANDVHSSWDFRSGFYTLKKLYNPGLAISFLNLFPWNDRPGKERLASQMSGLHCSYGNRC